MKWQKDNLIGARDIKKQTTRRPRVLVLCAIFSVIRLRMGLKTKLRPGGQQKIICLKRSCRLDGEIEVVWKLHWETRKILRSSHTVWSGGTRDGFPILRYVLG